MHMRVTESKCDPSSSRTNESDNGSDNLTVASGEFHPPVLKTKPDWVNVEATKERMWHLVWKPHKIYGVSINPVTSIMTTGVLWIFICVCISTPDASKEVLKGMQDWITEVGTWLYIITQNAWVIFILLLYFSKYSNIKLGKDSDEPEFSNLSWFVMLFSCGVGNELFYYGVSEPVTHYTAQGKDAHRYSHLSENERAEFAITVTWYHFGLHGWVVYSIVAVIVALMSFRKDLPLTMRSCFYPILGDKVFGIIGDLIDMMSAVCTLMGVCTVLGLGVFDMNSGLTRLTGCQSFSSRNDCVAVENDLCSWKDLGRCKPTCEYNTESQCNDPIRCKWDDDGKLCKQALAYTYGIPQTLSVQLCLIWGITAVATISVVTGIKFGIRTMAITCFTIGMFLWLFVFLSDGPWFFLDVICQQIGLYIQWLFQLGFQTDAWARHTVTPSTKLNITNIMSSTDSHVIGEISQGADKGWMGHWTVFYWGWWVAWAPFVGTFIAKISRGRTIGELILGSMISPMLYSFLWFGVFGSSGIKMERFAEAAQLDAMTSPAYIFYNATTGKPLDPVEACNSPWDTTGDNICRYASRISKVSHGNQWLDMISQFGDLGAFMLPMSLVAIVLYFVTSADSGCLVIDSLCSNGSNEAHRMQKIYWAVTQGASTSALMYIGSSKSKDALEALQAASLCCGLPYTIILCFMCVSIWKACKYECGEITWARDRFWRTDLSDFLDIKLNYAWFRRVGRTIFGVVAPTYYIWTSFPHLDLTLPVRRMLIALMTMCFYISPIMWCLDVQVKGLAHIGWFFFLSFVCLLTFVRQSLRIVNAIDGNVAEDLFACLLLFGAVADQLDENFSDLDVGSKADGGVEVQMRSV